MDRFSVPAARQRFEIEIKRSRFITTVAPVKDKRDALTAIESIRLEFPGANHHCWAMVAAAPTNVYHQDQCDDGEPKGTAGKPMLNVLLHSNLGHTLVVVTRFFGGIKLGAGGLVRAYTQCVSSALKDLQTRVQLIGSEQQLRIPYSQLNSFEHWLRSTEIDVVEKNFTDSVILRLIVPLNAHQSLQSKLAELGGELIPAEKISVQTTNPRE